MTFCGEQADVVPLLQQADVFVFPSRTDTFGLVMIVLPPLSVGVTSV